MHELPGRGVVELSVTEISRAQPFRSELYLHVVGAVAGEPVDLVQDDVVDVFVLGRADSASLKLRPGGDLARLAPVDELGHDFGAQVLGLA